jgi:hypothetical protein
MMNIFDIHDYDDNFLDQFASHTLPIYDLWSIRPLQNEQKEIISGTCDEIAKFKDFIINHSNKDYPHPLVIVIGNSEKSTPGNMLNSTKKYFKVKFEKYKGNDLGQPLLFGAPQNYPASNEQVLPFGYGVNPRMNTGIHGFGGMNMAEIQGVIDRNVSDATRSIRAEYEEMVAKREAESIRRITELEMRMEIYKLELRAKELADKESKIREELIDLEVKKAEGLGNVREYTKTIAGGLLELGKSAFGIDEVIPKKKSHAKAKEEEPATYRKAESRTNTVSGFTEKQTNTSKPKSGLGDIVGMLNNLSDDEKYELMEIIMNSDESEEESISELIKETEANTEKHTEKQPSEQAKEQTEIDQETDKKIEKETNSETIKNKNSHEDISTANND